MEKSGRKAKGRIDTRRMTALKRPSDKAEARLTENAQGRKDALIIQPDGASRDKTRLTEATEPCAISWEKSSACLPAHTKGERFRDPRNGPAGQAFATALARPSAGHAPFVVIARPGVPTKPLTLYVNKAQIGSDFHGNATWGASQAGIAKADRHLAHDQAAASCAPDRLVHGDVRIADCAEPAAGIVGGRHDRRVRDFHADHVGFLEPRRIVSSAGRPKQNTSP